MQVNIDRSLDQFDTIMNTLRSLNWKSPYRLTDFELFILSSSFHDLILHMGERVTSETIEEVWRQILEAANKLRGPYHWAVRDANRILLNQAISLLKVSWAPDVSEARLPPLRD